MRVTMEIVVSMEVHKHLDHLRRTGLFGDTVEETASLLLSERLRDPEVAVWCKQYVRPGAVTLAKK